MKSKLLVPCIIGVMMSVNSVAQTVAPQANWYEAEGYRYYAIDRCVPGTDIVFYSEPWGGKRLKTAKAGTDGRLEVVEDISFKPAYIMNNQIPINQSGQQGSGKICFLDRREFGLSTPELTVKNGQVSLHWKGSAREEGAIVFEVQKSTDGAHYSTVARYNTSVQEMSFTYTDEAGEPMSNQCFYQVSVVHKDAGARYTTGPISLIAGPRVFPTIVTDQLTIIVAANAAFADYKIIGSAGQTIVSGHLISDKNNLSIGNLPSGTYYVVIGYNGKASTSKIIKL